MNTPHASIINEDKGTSLHGSPEFALTVWQRIKGFMFSKTGDRALVFLMMPARSELIHMFFVFGSLDLIALDGEGKVIGMKQGIRPWKLWKTPVMSALLELPVGTIVSSKTEIGDRILLPKVTIPGWARQT